MSTSGMYMHSHLETSLYFQRKISSSQKEKKKKMSALRSQRQVDLSDFKAILVYIMTSRLARAV